MGKERRAARRLAWMQMIEQKPSILDGRFLMQVTLIIWVILRLITFALEWIYLQQNQLNLTILQSELLSIGFTCLLSFLAWQGLHFLLVVPMLGSVMSLWQMAGSINFALFLQEGEYLYALYVGVLLVSCFAQFFLCGMLLCLPSAGQYCAARRNLWFVTPRDLQSEDAAPPVPASVANDPLEQMAQQMLHAQQAQPPESEPDDPEKPEE